MVVVYPHQLLQAMYACMVNYVTPNPGWDNFSTTLKYGKYNLVLVPGTCTELYFEK